MTDIRSQILSEVEEHLGSGYVQMMHEAMERCPTLKNLINFGDRNVGGFISPTPSITISEIQNDFINSCSNCCGVGYTTRGHKKVPCLLCAPKVGPVNYDERYYERHEPLRPYIAESMGKNSDEIIEEMNRAISKMNIKPEGGE